MKQNNFEQLKTINVALTQKCNRACSYCYEQHNKTNGSFTVDTLIKTYNFLRDNSNLKEKYLQFFGGEPLLESKLIIDFLETYKDEIKSNPDIRISMSTNGLLLTEKILDKFAEFPATIITVSLDSHLPDPQYRNMSQKQIDHVLSRIKIAIDKGVDVSIGCTIGQDIVERLDAYIDKLVSLGVTQMIIHPLTLSKTDGYIEWTEEKWAILEGTLYAKIKKYPQLKIHFSEGVEKKSAGATCMVGTSSITVDGNGDYTGCYFFTNLKDIFNDAILGNIFTGEIHNDKYEYFRKEFTNYFSANPECNTCDLGGYCYQCPAGNLASTEGGRYQSTTMCKKIVKLYLELKRDETEKKLIDKIEKIKKALEEDGDIFLARSLFQLAHKNKFGKYFNPTELAQKSLPHYTKIIKFFYLDNQEDYSLENLEELNKYSFASLQELMTELNIGSYYHEDSMAENLALIELTLLEKYNE